MFDVEHSAASPFLVSSFKKLSTARTIVLWGVSMPFFANGINVFVVRPVSTRPVECWKKVS